MLLEEHNAEGFLVFSKGSGGSMVNTVYSWGFPCVFITDEINYNALNYHTKVPTLSKDYYSAGYEIASTFVECWQVSHLTFIEDIQMYCAQYGGFPIVAGNAYKSNISFLLGMSNVLGVPVRVLSSDMEIYDYRNEVSGNVFEYLIFFDIYDPELLDELVFCGINPANVFFFGYDETALQACKNISPNVYLIEDRVDYTEAYLVTLYMNGEVNLDEMENWVIDTSLVLRYDWVYSNEECPYITYWRELGYNVSTRNWDTYLDFCATVSMDGFETYWNTYKLCWVAQEVIAL